MTRGSFRTTRDFLWVLMKLGFDTHIEIEQLEDHWEVSRKYV